jgi:hypothetical protein
MKTVRRVIDITVTASIALGLCLTCPGFVAAEGGRIVRVYGNVEEDEYISRLEPDEIWVGRQTTLVWVNMSDAEIKVIFLEGQTCKTSSSPAKGWKLDKKACYITNSTLPPGGTASIYFTRVGEFNYDIEYVGKSEVERGKIVVRTEAKGAFGKPALK